jgi:hypothetical protein
MPWTELFGVLGIMSITRDGFGCGRWLALIPLVVTAFFSGSLAEALELLAVVSRMNEKSEG